MAALTRSQGHGIVGGVLVLALVVGVYLLATTLLGGQGYDYSPRWSDQSAGQTPLVSADQRTVHAA